MADALAAFFAVAAGNRVSTITIDDGGRQVEVLAGGAADIVVFVGHNGLMDTPLPPLPDPPLARQKGRGAIVLCCKSVNGGAASFRPPLDRVGCDFLVGTMGLMAPEAYTLDAAIRVWADGGEAEHMRTIAAEAYAKYQRCRLESAMRLFSTALPEEGPSD
jgi:hypothetical protein